MSATVPVPTRWSGHALACLVLLALVAVLLPACATGHEGPLRADPGTLRLSPARTEVQLAIHNDSSVIRPVTDFAFSGPDWGTLRFVDEGLPRTIPGEDFVVVTVAVSAAALRNKDGSFRRGEAVVEFASDSSRYQVPVEFVPSTPTRGWLPAGLLAIATVLVGAWLLAGQPTRAAGPPSPPYVRTLAATAVAASLVAVALVPLGPGRCAGRTLAAVGPLELEQCRAGLGGSGLVGLSPEPSLLVWLAALMAASVFATLTYLALLPERPPQRRLVATGARVLGLLLTIAALLTAEAPPDPNLDALVLVQAEPTGFAGLRMPAWGALAQPFAFVLLWLLHLGTGLAAVTAGDRSPDQPLVRMLVALDELVWALVLVTLFLGGWLVPGLSLSQNPILSHGFDLAVAFAVLVGQVALLGWLGNYLRSWISWRREPLAWARILLPLLALDLAATALWRVAGLG